MRAILLALAWLYAFAGACWLLSRGMRRWEWPRWPVQVIEVTGTSVGVFTTGLLVLLAYSFLFPTENQGTRNARGLRELTVRVDSIDRRVDSLETRVRR